MALISPTYPKIAGTFNNEALLVLWATALSGSTFKAFENPGYRDRTVQVEGSFFGTSISIEGSNDGTNYHTLNDPSGNPLTFTSAGIKQVLELTRWIRPAMTGGDSGGTTSVAVNMLAVAS